MIGYPLDSHVTFNDGVPEYDRAISSAPLRELFKRLWTDGVLPDVASNLKVQYVGATRISGTVSGDSSTYNVVVNPGFGICAGCLKLQENYYGLTMDLSDTSNPRIDTVVLRLNDNDSVRSCDFFIVQGTPSASPVAPYLTRDATVWEIGLANLYKPATVSSANPVTVTDTRLDSSRCGVISSLSEFDTTALYDQIQDALDRYKQMTDADMNAWFSSQQYAFSTWFESVKGQLSTDVAGNLQSQVGALSLLNTSTKADLVSAINEALTQTVYKVPSRTLSTISTQSLVGNPIPTSWIEGVAGTEYTSGGYKVTAGNYSAGYEAYKAFDNNSNTAWRSDTSTAGHLTVEFPTNILVDKIRLHYSAASSVTVKIQSSSNGTSWTDELSITTHPGVETEFTLSNSPTTKYLRFYFTSTGGVNVTVYSFKISDYTITTYKALFTLNNIPTMVDGQRIFVQISDTHDTSGVVENTLNDSRVDAILQAGKRYELTYSSENKYYAKEVG